MTKLLPALYALSLVVGTTAASGASGRELCGKAYTTIDDLRMQIESELHISRDNPEWTTYDDPKNGRSWVFSRETVKHQSAVCLSIEQSGDGSWGMKSHVSCWGPTAACDQIGALWDDWVKKTSAAMKVDSARRHPAPTP